MEDITQEVKLERLKEEWNRLILHDVRSPLATINGVLVLLSKDHRLNPTQESYRQTAAYAIRKIIDLLNKYLDVEKLLSSPIEPHPESVPLKEVVERQGYCVVLYIQVEGGGHGHF